jgi:hypothetical protein
MQMAKAKITKEVEVEQEVQLEQPEFVEVEYFAGDVDMAYHGPGYRVLFEKGKALVPAAVAQELKEAKLIK